MRRLAMGFVWFVVLYFGGCMLVGGIAGGVAGANLRPGQDPAIVGAEAGSRAVETYAGVIAGGALLASIAGASLGFLPGTGERRLAQ
jgi:hypothetical protein